MRDHAEVVRMLLLKTQANGCTPEEEATARAKAHEIAAKHGIPVGKPKEPFLHDVLDEVMREMRQKMRDTVRRNFEDAQREAAWREELRRQQEKHARERAKPSAERTPSFSSVGQAAEWYLTKFRSTPHEQLAAKVRSHFPGSKTSAKSMAWYASKLRSEGKL